MKTQVFVVFSSPSAGGYDAPDFIAAFSTRDGALRCAAANRDPNRFAEVVEVELDETAGMDLYRGAWEPGDTIHDGPIVGRSVRLERHS